MSVFGSVLQPAGVDLPKELFGFEVLDYLGQGARSDIYVVSDPDSKQVYALKYVVRKSEKDDRFIEQLENETRTKEELHQGEIKKLQTKYDSDTTKLKQVATDWENRYGDLLITNDLMTAAVTSSCVENCGRCHLQAIVTASSR